MTSICAEPAVDLRVDHRRVEVGDVEQRARRLGSPVSSDSGTVVGAIGRPA